MSCKCKCEHCENYKEQELRSDEELLADYYDILYSQAAHDYGMSKAGIMQALGCEVRMKDGKNRATFPYFSQGVMSGCYQNLFSHIASLRRLLEIAYSNPYISQGDFDIEIEKLIQF